MPKKKKYNLDEILKVDTDAVWLSFEPDLCMNGESQQDASLCNSS